MDVDRPHRTTSTPTTTSELFICFTSRLSNSSSMRLTSSKSILSPGRGAGDKAAAVPQISLSSSLSRRLRHSGSLRGGQSPAMFPPSRKQGRGASGFETANPEPSSPKVTCIGQVRVKTKKQGKKMKMRACRSKRLSGGEASFRRIEHGNEGLTHQNSQGIQSQAQDCGLNHRNQRWVHLPLTICEALRTFGAEFSCLLPCKSSCFSSEREKIEKGEHEQREGSSCGAVFRWLVALQEGEGGEKRGDIELVVEERKSEERMECSSRRRSIFDDMEFKDEIFDAKNDGDEDGDGAARVSICIPPKNALLLMRCRSDPMRMASLSHKIFEANVPKDIDVEEAEEEGVGEKQKEENVEEKIEEYFEEKREEHIDEKTEAAEVEAEVEREKLGDGTEDIDEMCEDLVKISPNVEVYETRHEDLAVVAQEEEQQTQNKEENEEAEGKQSTETEEKQNIENRGETVEQEIVNVEEPYFPEDENQSNRSLIDAIKEECGLENGEKEQDLLGKAEETEEDKERGESSDLSTSSFSNSSSAEESTADSAENQNQKESESEEEKEIIEENVKSSMEEGQERESIDREGGKPAVLPDCLLLMMCEPKLSMEVSKETWVCSTDFIRWLPERHHSKKPPPTKPDGSDELLKKPAKKKDRTALPPAAATAAVAAEPIKPGRASISFPAASLIEQKLVKAGVGSYEPFVLTRCKSAPMRSTAWRKETGRQMEPHRPAACGVGAAGVGF